MNGNNILIYWKGPGDSSYSVIAATKSHEVQTECEAIPISTPVSSAWRQNIAGHRQWSVNVNYLLMAESDLSQLLKVGTTFGIVIQARDHQQGGTNVSGTAILTQCKQTFTRGNLCVGSFHFVGSGPLV